LALKEQILAILEESDAPSSGSGIAARLGVSRTAVWKGVEALRADGYTIESATNRGYRLAGEQDILSRSRILSCLGQTRLPWQLEVAGEVDSTNTRLKELARRGAPDCTALTADRQTAGRGRMGRTFVSPKGGGVYLSLLLRPKIPVSRCTDLTVAAAVCTARAIQQTCGVSPQIKWVNDLMLEGKKLCGILTEAAVEVESGLADYVIVGIGVNARPVDTGGDAALAAIVTSLQQACGHPVLRNRLIAAMLREGDSDYAGMEGNQPSMWEEYGSRMFGTGRQVTLSTDPLKRPHLVLGVDDQARLLVADPEGRRLTLQSGEVSVLPLPPQAPQKK